MLRARRDTFRVFLFYVIFPSVFTSHSAFNSRVSEVLKVILTFFVMSETRWEAFEDVSFFSKRSIAIKLPVTVIGKIFCLTKVRVIGPFPSALQHGYQ